MSSSHFGGMYSLRGGESTSRSLVKLLMALFNSSSCLLHMRLESKAPNLWGTIYGVFPVPKGVVAVDLMLGQGLRRATPHDGSAARVTNVEVRFFDTEAAARSYVTVYNAAHDIGRD